MPDDKSHCFMFEMVSTRNRVVTMPFGTTLLLHGARNIHLMSETDPTQHNTNWQCVKQHEDIPKNLGIHHHHANHHHERHHHQHHRGFGGCGVQLDRREKEW